MSLLFISAWIRYMNKGLTPDNCDKDECREDPAWTCERAIIRFFGDYKFPPYKINFEVDKRRDRNIWRRTSAPWQYTEILAVNDRIRIYK